MLPLCFEEGCVNGFATGTPQFMNTAAETYLKEILADLFYATRHNGTRWIKTAAYKRRYEREVDGWHRGEIRKSISGQLPVEQEAERARLPLSMVDIRLNLDLTGSTLEVPTVAMRIYESTGIDDEEPFLHLNGQDGRGSGAQNGSMLAPPRPLMNGVNGLHKEEDDYGWAGVLESDRMVLDNVLEDCLAGL
jgi:transcriptional coactivator HFI1/ADA1